MFLWVFLNQPMEGVDIIDVKLHHIRAYYFAMNSMSEQTFNYIIFDFLFQMKSIT